MDELVQGVLANNLPAPDVEIQEFKTDAARSRLKNAINKSALSSPKASAPTHYKTKVSENVQPHFIKKHTSDNLLAFEVAKLSNKLDNFEKNAKILEDNQKDKRTLELEKKLHQITDERLQYLEKLQHEQEQWKSQYFHTLKKLNNMQASSPIAKSKLPNGCHPTSIYTKQNILETPLPRKTVPQPASSGRIGNGQFLRDILDQSASTPDVSHLHHIKPVDTIPVRLNEAPHAWNHNANVVSDHHPSPIKPSSSQIIAKEIETEAERKQISEKFPNSISEYLPHANTSPVTHLLSEAIPPSSLVSEFRQKLRKLMEMRSNLENNLQAVQRKPHLTDYATAALLKQLEEDGFISTADQKLCRIHKLVDEEINLHLRNVKAEVREELAAQKQKPSKTGRPSGFSKRAEPQKLKLSQNQKMKKSHLPKKTIKTQVVAKKAEVEERDESFVTHVYGKADYHPHRTTVHEPFMHVTSPIKSPKFRTKRALQAVPATYVRSEKTQTRDKIESPTLLKSKYLAPTAISLRPPQIFENEPDPVLVHAAQPVVRVPTTPSKSPVIKKVEIMKETDCLPGNDTLFSPDNCDTSDGEKELEVDGEGCCRRSFPKPRTPPPSKRKSPVCRRSPVQLDPETCPLEKVKCWVEQEIMSKILNQIYPASSTQQTQTLNLETDTMKKLLEDEIQAQIRQLLLKRNQTRPKVPVHEPELPCVIHTPVPTPESTPSPSVSPSHHSVKTPLLSTETSVCETEEEPEPPRIPSPEVSTSHEIVEKTLIPTPQETPVSTPEVSVKEESIESKSALSITDPWEGKMPEDLHFAHSSFKLPQKVAPDPEPTDLIVRSLTPPPEPKKSLSSSESSNSSSDLATEDKTISEGQLVIEHGEMKLKKRKPLQIPENYEELMNHNTLKDVDDLEPISEGEYRSSTRPPIVQTRYADIMTDDPSGIYMRPRKPGVDSDAEDLSVGEVPDKKRRKFDKWKAAVQSASPPQGKKDENPLSLGDLDSTSAGSDLEELAPHVIMVTSLPTRAVEGLGNQSKEFAAPVKSDQIIRDSLDDHVVKPRSQMTLTIPSTEHLSATSDTEEISVQDF